jgi:hypothetical protein
MRPLSRIPHAVIALLIAALLLQVTWHAQRAPSIAAAPPLPPAPSMPALKLASLGEPIALSKLLMLYVQGRDEQAWRALDYGRLRDWLGDALDLDPRSQAPLLAASEVYGAVNDPQRVRVMLDFVYQRFGEDPNRRWPWLAHAVLVARHRLHDPPLARRYAQALRTEARGPDVPAWAHQLELFILDDMGQRDSERALIGAMLHNGQVSDPRELRFLARRLDALDAQPR